MNGLGSPAYYVVTKQEMVDFVEAKHQEWLAGRKRDCGERKDTCMRRFADREGKYRDRWDLLALADEQPDPRHVRPDPPTSSKPGLDSLRDAVASVDPPQSAERHAIIPPEI